MSYSELVSGHERLTILRLLAEQNDYKVNESLLREMMDRMGFTLSIDKLHTQCAWLQEQGLVKIEEVHGLKIVEINKRGDDVAKGIATVPGIRRPGPAH